MLPNIWADSLCLYSKDIVVEVLMVKSREFGGLPSKVREGGWDKVRTQLRLILAKLDFPPRPPNPIPRKPKSLNHWISKNEISNLQ